MWPRFFFLHLISRLLKVLFCQIWGVIDVRQEKKFATAQCAVFHSQAHKHTHTRETYAKLFIFLPKLCGAPANGSFRLFFFTIIFEKGNGFTVFLLCSSLFFFFLLFIVVYKFLWKKEIGSCTKTIAFIFQIFLFITHKTMEKVIKYHIVEKRKQFKHQKIIRRRKK